MDGKNRVISITEIWGQMEETILICFEQHIENNCTVNTRG